MLPAAEDLLYLVGRGVGCAPGFSAQAPVAHAGQFGRRGTRSATEELAPCRFCPAVLRGNADQLGGRHARVESVSGRGRTIRTFCEVGHHLAGQSATLCGGYMIPGMGVRFRDAIAQKQLPEDLGNVLYPPVGPAQLTPIVCGNKGADQQRLVTHPVESRRTDIVRAFEVVVSLATKVGRVMPHTGVCRRVESQCQWGVSPSVMAVV
jgi:hypothetical protein